MPGEARPWHVLEAAQAARELGVDPARGLEPAQARERLARHGRNEIEEQRRRPWWRMLADQFRDFMVMVLIGAAVVSGVLGEPVDTLAILVIVVLNALVGFVQEYRAERTVAALRGMAAPLAHALRAGELHELDAAELVPGDLVVLEAGNVVPADLRLVDTHELRVDEAALTGESEPIDKRTTATPQADAPLGDRACLAYKGTLVTRGRGGGIVVATGMQTELGRIATLLGREELQRTPLQRRLARFGRRLALAVLAICALVFAAGVLRGEPPVRMFLTAVSLAVAAIPEALPAVVTIGLALGARRMARHRALVRRLPAVETLGSITTICSDKTGTLTQNTMRAEAFHAAGERRASAAAAEGDAPAWPLLVRAMALASDASAAGSGASDAVCGDPTEVALLRAAIDAGFPAVGAGARAARLGELPFDSERKRMTTLHAAEDGAGAVSFTKGAPESVLPRCTRAAGAREGAHFDPDELLAQAEQLAAEGYRVLAFAQRRWPAAAMGTLTSGVLLSPEEHESGLEFLGLVALVDPPRPEAAESVALCRGAGIRPVMITGDHPATARAIAVRLGIASEGARVVTGRELAAGSARSTGGGVGEVSVFARVDPAQKIEIVRALQERGELVAMTGDGVNDAPALRRADIGVAMGLKGTDVAREAAEMILLDDDFSTIVRAVREGRRIYDNVRKFVKYTMTSNAGEIWALSLAPFLGLPIPLLPVQILWINLVTDGLPGLALSTERAEPAVMRRPPRPPGESLFARGAWQHMLWCGLLIGLLALGAQAWALGEERGSWRTMAFTVLTFAQLVHALAVRSETESLLRLGLGSNRALLAAVLATFVVQLAAVYTPLGNALLHTQPLDAGELALCLGLSWTVLLAVELEKWMARRGWIYDLAAPPARSSQ